MTPYPTTVTPDQPIENVATIMHDKKTRGLPVVNKDGSIAGIITESDVFELLITLSGLKKTHGS